VVVVVADKIRRLLPDTRPILRGEILRTYDSLFDWRKGLLLVVFAGKVGQCRVGEPHRPPTSSWRCFSRP
jgi:hypothetical protein